VSAVRNAAIDDKEAIDLSPRRRALVRDTGAEIQTNDNPELDNALREIEAACSTIVGRARRAKRICESPTSAAVVGPGVQTSDTEPRHERAFDWLDLARSKLREILRESL
jgi:hypothetical protein